MPSLADFISQESTTLLSEAELDYLNNIFLIYQGLPSLKQLWHLLDQAWDQFDCHGDSPYSSLSLFYRHPVWILNGIYSQHDLLSIFYRKLFTDYVIRLEPLRILDVGGGFGALARSIGASSPSSTIDIYEPHPHAIAKSLANITKNVRYYDKPDGHYDMIIAIDVFEHLQNPLDFLAKTLAHLNPGGKYLFANCFLPVIKCHLPQNIHFHASWPLLLSSYGLRDPQPVAYGSAFSLTDRPRISDVSKIIKLSKLSYQLSSWLPKGKHHLNKLIFKSIAFFS